MQYNMSECSVRVTLDNTGESVELTEFRLETMQTVYIKKDDPQIDSIKKHLLHGDI